MKALPPNISPQLASQIMRGDYGPWSNTAAAGAPVDGPPGGMNAPWVSEWRLGIVTAHGPATAAQSADYARRGLTDDQINDELAADPATADDATAPRYWVRLAMPDASVAAGGQFVAVTETKPGIAAVVRATNLAEPVTSHAIRTDDVQVVQLFRVIYPGPAMVSHWVFSLAPSEFRRRVRVTGSTQDGTNKRWKYTAVEVELTTVGYDGWTDKSGGATWAGGEPGAYVYNLAEEMNGASGTFGNGVSSTNLSGTFDVQPIPDDMIVTVTRHLTTEGEPVWWTNVANGIDGACS